MTCNLRGLYTFREWHSVQTRFARSRTGILDPSRGLLLLWWTKISRVLTDGAELEQLGEASKVNLSAHLGTNGGAAYRMPVTHKSAP